MRRYWDILGLSEDASAEDLRARYRQLVKEWHPDKFVSNGSHRAAAEARLKLINEAYHVLKTARGHRRRTDEAPSDATSRNYRRGAEHAAPESSAAGSPLSWLETEPTLTYLPLVMLVLTVAQQRFDAFLPAAGVVGLLLVIAWSMMAWTVLHNRAISFPSRIMWVTVMVLFGGVAVPIYFARHVHAPTA